MCMSIRSSRRKIGEETTVRKGREGKGREGKKEEVLAKILDLLQVGDVLFNNFIVLLFHDNSLAFL